MQINITASKNRSKFVILDVQYTIIALVWGEHRKLLTDGDCFSEGFGPRQQSWGLTT